MKKQLWVVIDENGNTSWSAKNDIPEVFRSTKAALERATEMAALTPGQPFGIYKLVGEVKAAVSRPTLETVE